MALQKGAVRYKDENGRVRYKQPEQESDPVMAEEKETVEETAQEEQQLILTPDQLTDIISKAVDQATTPLAEQIAELSELKAPKRKMNADYQRRAIMGESPIQTQEDVYTLAAQVGPVSHGAEYMPTPPEFVTIRDFNDNRQLINDVEALGYVVELHGVEFSVRWQPLDEQGVVIRDKEEPNDEYAQALLHRLGAIEPINSRLWYDRHFAGKIVTGERQIDEMVEEDAHGKALAQIGKIETAVNLNGVMPSQYQPAAGSEEMGIVSEKGAHLDGVDMTKIGE
jgi:hypothetical protein